MRLLLRNVSLSVDVGRRFNNREWNQWPLTADKYASWIHALTDAEVINIFNDYHVFGLRNPADTGIFNFFEALPGAILANKDFYFATCAEVSKEFKPSAEIDVPEFMSWDDNGRDLSAWLGNDMQKDAIHALYAMTNNVHELNNPAILRDFERLQTADHFHNMSTRWFTVFAPDRPNPFPSPYDAYIVYMNVLSDLEMRIKAGLAEPSKTSKSHPRHAAAEKRELEKKEHEVERKEAEHAAKHAKTAARRKTASKTE